MQGQRSVPVEFWSLWSAEEKRLRRLCIAMLRSSDDAEDALHNALLRAAERFDGRIRKPGPWLTAVTRNVCLESLRGLNRDRLRRSDMDIDFAAAEGDLETQIVQRDQLASLREAIDALPVRLREAARLRFLGGLAHRQVARMLNISEAAARKRVQHARESLGRSYQHELTWQDLEPAALRVDGPESLQISAEPEYDELRFDSVGSSLLSLACPGQGCRERALYGPYATQRAALRQPALERYVARYPGGWKKRLELAWILGLQGKTAEACLQLEELRRRRPDLLPPVVLLGDLYRLQARRTEAAACYRAAGAIAHKESTRLLLGALCKEATIDSAEALTALIAAAKSDPKNPEGFRRAMRLAADLRRETTAIEMGEAARRLSPTDLCTRSQLAWLLWRQHRFACAADEADAALQIDPRDAVALFVRVQLHNRVATNLQTVGRRTPPELRRLAISAPDSLLYAVARAERWLATGGTQRARRLLIQAASERPGNSFAWEALARLHVQQNAWNLAAAAIQQALALTQPSTAALRLAARVAEKQNNAALSQAIAKRLLTIEEYDLSARLLARCGASRHRVLELLSRGEGKRRDAWGPIDAADAWLELGDAAAALRSAESAMHSIHPLDFGPRARVAAAIAARARQAIGKAG